MSVYLSAADLAHLLALQQREIAELDMRIDRCAAPVALVQRLRKERDECHARAMRLVRFARSYYPGAVK